MVEPFKVKEVVNILGLAGKGSQWKLVQRRTTMLLVVQSLVDCAGNRRFPPPFLFII